MSATTEQIVDWLQRKKDPESLIRWLCKRGLDYKTLCHELEQIKLLWCQVHGDSEVQNSSVYQSSVQRIRRNLDDKDDSIKKVVINYLQMPFHQQYKVHTNGMLHNYTGCTAVDAMLHELVVLPPYIQGLRVTCRRLQSKSKKHGHSNVEHKLSATAPTTSSPCDTPAAVREEAALAPSKGATRKQMSPTAGVPDQQSNHIRERNVRQGLKGGDLQTQLANMLEVLKYSRVKPFELACALAFMSGRSLAELMALGHFKNSTVRASPYPEVLFRASNSSKCHSVPLLCDSSAFLEGVDRLRQMKSMQGKDCKDINKSHCKTANTAAKTLLSCSTAVFTDLRIAYTALTFKLYAIRPEGSSDALSSQMKEWLAQCLPLAKLGTSPTFLAQCCTTLLGNCGIALRRWSTCSCIMP
jgi:hypothetical protein